MIDIDVYFDRYVEMEGLLPGRVEAIGQTYRSENYLDREQLQALAQECSRQSARYIETNSVEACVNATYDIQCLRYDASKVAALCGLNGVSVPTASFILTALDPLNYGIVNRHVQRSLRYLGYIDTDRDKLRLSDYTEMLHHIRTIADEERCTAAAVGYALAAHGRIIQDRDRISITAEDTPVLDDTDPGIDTASGIA